LDVFIHPWRLARKHQRRVDVTDPKYNVAPRLGQVRALLAG
jgi:hypothetical protein